LRCFGRAAQDAAVDDEDVRLIMVTLLDVRAGVDRLVTELLHEDEDGPGEEEEA
jgi:hypothetical protein